MQPRQEEQPSDDHLFFLEVKWLISCIFFWLICARMPRFFVLWLVALIRESSGAFQAKLCSGKFIVIEARRKGFFSLGKQRVLCHNLVDLLRHLSRPFDNVSLSP